MTRDQSDQNAAAAEWLQQKIRQSIKEAERQFGVYVFIDDLGTDGRGDYERVIALLNIWPESMRIIETERDSKAIG